MFHYSAATNGTYDGGLGYVFVIASWRPMHFERFRTGDTWDSFEVADDSYMRDPRPAIHELATLLAGDNSEAYTVKFARFTDFEGIERDAAISPDGKFVAFVSDREGPLDIWMSQVGACLLRRSMKPVALLRAPCASASNKG